MDEEYEVKVSRQLEDLVPGFLENRRKDLELLRAAIAVRDFTALSQIGHRLKGVGRSYGFDQISIMGEKIEAAAKEADGHLLVRLIDDYGHYVRQVKVTYE
jgi:HPt (histidine-containing phosphotransfer) domain-containing protein